MDILRELTHRVQSQIFSKCRKIVIPLYAEARQFYLLQIQCKHTSNILRRILRGGI